MKSHLIAIGFSLVCTSFPAGIAAAQPAETPEAQQERLKEIERKLRENEVNARAIRLAAEKRAQELEDLRDDMAETANSLRHAEGRASKIEARLADLKKQLAQYTGDLNQQRKALSEILAALQAVEMARPPALAVSPDDAATAARAAMAFSTLAPELEQQAAALNAEIIKIEALDTEMREQQKSQREVEINLKARRRVLDDLVHRKQVAYQQDTSKLAKLSDEKASLAREATTIREVLDNLAQDNLTQDNIPPASTATIDIPTPRQKPVQRAQRPALQAYRNLPRRFFDAKGIVPYPAEGTVTGRFGDKDGNGEKLEGFQLRTRSGAVVTAPFAGTVAFAGNLGRLGNVFMLDVGDNYHVILVGLGRFTANVGEQIRAGDPIGFMPRTLTTNQAVAQNLYFEIRKNREPQDPKIWMMEISG